MKYICIIISLFITSCKSPKSNLNEESKYVLIEKVLNETYSKTLNFEIYTRDFSIGSFESFIQNIKVDTNIDTIWFKDFSNLKNFYTKNKFDKWNPEMISIKNLNTKFELKQKDNQGYLKEMIERDNLNAKKAYEKRVTYWVKENGNYEILSASAPVFSENNEKAILITSIYNRGITVWLFDKIDGAWKLKLNKEVAMY